MLLFSYYPTHHLLKPVKVWYSNLRNKSKYTFQAYMTKLFYFSGEGMIYMAGIIGSASGRKNKQDSLLYALYKNKWEKL